MLATLVILVFKFVSSVWQIGGFLLVLRFSLPIKPLGRRVLKVKIGYGAATGV